MHIAVIGSRSSIHVVRWANALAREGFQITVFSMHQEGEDFDDAVNFVRLPFGNPAGYVLNIPFLKTKIQDLNPDIVHSFYALGHGFLGRMSGGKPHLISVLGSDIFDDIHVRKVYKTITEKNLRSADCVASTSLVMAKEIRKLCGNDFPIKITPFGVDTDQFAWTDRSGRTYDTQPFRFGTVKWLEPKYGVDVLITSFARFMEEMNQPNAELMIVGDGKQRSELEKLASSLGVEEKCKFIGSVSHQNVPFWLEKLDIYMALSQLNSESFGVAILEASSTGLSVIVSDVGGLPEVVQHGHSGFVVQHNNVAEIVKKMKKLYISSSKRLEMGRKGRNLVLNKYKWEQSVDMMIDIYKSII
jgi:glycosyltransferase involved in cell wall biosynthesis